MSKLPFNMACIYMAANSRLPWTVSQIMPYIVHTYQKNGITKKKWFFDSFLMLDFEISVSGQKYALSLGKYKYKYNDSMTQLVAEPADKSVWEELLDRYFGTANQIGVLKKFNDTIALAKQDLGEPGFKHRVMLGLPEPLSHYPNPQYNPTDPDSRLHLPVFSEDPNGPGFLWGLNEQNQQIVFRRIQNGNVADLTDEYSGCSYAVNWFIDECLSRWDSDELQHLELSGFYWINEGGPGRYNAFETIEKVKHHIETINLNQSLNLQLIFSPYYNFYDGKWTVNGNGTPYREQCQYFDIVFAQPNYSLGAGSVIPTGSDSEAQAIEASQYTRFMNAITKAVNLNDGIDVELDEHCMYNYDNKAPKRQERVGRYLEALRNKYHMDLLYYTGNAVVTYIEDDTTTYYHNNVACLPTDEDFAMIHQLALFVDRRRRQIEAFNAADVNEDGDVDVVDMQIVLNEMLGINTGYGDRADVNHDGYVDITDYNQVAHVMLGHLDEMGDDE